METELCKIAIKYKTDKVKHYRHNYTPIYYDLFKEKRYKFNNVFEIGLGYIGNNVMQHMKHTNYEPGASLYMWEEFFPHSNIYGVDINKNILFETDRIKTYYMDQYNLKDLKQFTEITNHIKFDIIIDDGSHIPEHQVYTMLYFLDYLTDDGIYVIEDVSPKFYNNIKKYLNEQIIEEKGFNIKHINMTTQKVKDDYLIVLSKK